MVKYFIYKWKDYEGRPRWPDKVQQWCSPGRLQAPRRVCGATLRQLRRVNIAQGVHSNSIECKRSIYCVVRILQKCKSNQGKWRAVKWTHTLSNKRHIKGLFGSLLRNSFLPKRFLNSSLVSTPHFFDWGEGGALRHRHQSSTRRPGREQCCCVRDFFCDDDASPRWKKKRETSLLHEILADHFISSFCYRVNGISATLRILSVRLFRCDSTLKLMCPSLVPNLMKQFLYSQLGKKKSSSLFDLRFIWSRNPPSSTFLYKMMFPDVRSLTFRRQGEPPVGKQQESSPTSSFWVVSANNGCVLLFSGIWIVPTKEKRNGSYHMDFRRVLRVV